jgi:hypothetical protein
MKITFFILIISNEETDEIDDVLVTFDWDVITCERRMTSHRQSTITGIYHV